MTWPPRWAPGPHFKSTVSPKVVRGVKRKAAGAAEDAHKRTVRRRDRFCRFPLCGCKTFKLRLDVSHGQHKGMGGNPKGDRSQPEGLILLCAARHRENSISVDRGTLRIRPLDRVYGLSGPCAFLVDVNKLRDDYGAHPQKWVEVARETTRHVLEPFKPAQRDLLERLAGMQF